MSKIQIPKGLREWNDVGEEYLPGLLGIEFTLIDGDEVRARIAVRKALLAWNGFLHAGSVVALADTACGYGTVNSLPEDAFGFTTLELKSNFLGTARDGFWSVWRDPCTGAERHKCGMRMSISKGETRQLLDFDAPS